MATVNDIVTQAFRKCGVRDADDTTLATGLSAFNTMIAAMDDNLKNAPVRENFTLTSGTAEYTIGSGGDFDTIRPVKILSAFIRDSDSNDYDVKVDMSLYGYDEVYDKDAPGRPERLYYSLEYPLGKIFFKTAPESAEDLYMASMKSLTIYSALTDTIDFPAEYEKFLIYNLAIDVAPEFNVNLQGNVIEQWGLLRNTISNRNANPIPTAKFDSALLR